MTTMYAKMMYSSSQGTTVLETGNRHEPFAVTVMRSLVTVDGISFESGPRESGSFVSAGSSGLR